MTHDHWPFEAALYSDGRLPALALEEVSWLARHPFRPQDCLASEQASLKVDWSACSIALQNSFGLALHTQGKPSCKRRVACCSKPKAQLNLQLTCQYLLVFEMGQCHQ